MLERSIYLTDELNSNGSPDSCKPIYDCPAPGGGLEVVFASRVGWREAWLEPWEAQGFAKARTMRFLNSILVTVLKYKWES